ncbi:hypothetical protein E8E11_002698 [Didymella keratinophila]|nr:hypothetical protein E8E11_002698 [Didymella keratinophila]
MAAQNDVQSPLLRLPPELRNATWELAFGNMVVHVEVRVRGGTYDDPGVDDPWFWFRFEGSTRETADSDGDTTEDRPHAPPIPGPVCRRFFAEATGVFYSTSIFSFVASMGFRALARSNLACVPRIQRIAFDLKGWRAPKHSIENFPYKWRNACTTSLVGRFRSLEGVTMEGVVKWDFADTGNNPDVMNDPVWKATEMSVVISAFQQHKLKEELTFVDIQRKHDPNYRPWHGRGRPGRRIYWDTAPASEAIRQELLKHKKPRRNPRRGE